MKKTIFVLLIIGLALCLGACNTAGGGEEEGEAKDITWNAEYGAKVEYANDYPGIEIPLTDRGLLDISNYASVTVHATLYTDEAGTKKASTPLGEKKNLAQFTLLNGAGEWTDETIQCGPTQYNMNVDGDTVWSVTASAKGVPTRLLLQANWKDFSEGVKVKYIRVGEITFTAKTSDVRLREVYDKGDYLTPAGNKLTFNNAMYKDAAAIYDFPATWTNLAGKQLVITFSIPNHSDVPSASGATDVEHQIHIQAANSDDHAFNGRNPPDWGGVGQKYITLDKDDPLVTGWNGSGGTIKVPLDDLLAAAAVTADTEDCKGPFVLDAIRIVNNGTTYNEPKDGTTITHVRCKTYTLVINSVTVQ